ncbi:DUF2277 family protein [Streptosporangium amethystogenes]|uniref:DUF2277 family protein n=1 Tax=Streptosporangium amethystogenes TaxID=2002 RepID=UPI0037A12275
MSAGWPCPGSPYVRKLSGFRNPSARNAEAFDRAVDAVAAATQVLLEDLRVKQAPRRHP